MSTAVLEQVKKSISRAISGIIKSEKGKSISRYSPDVPPSSIKNSCFVSDGILYALVYIENDHDLLMYRAFLEKQSLISSVKFLSKKDFESKKTNQKSKKDILEYQSSTITEDLTKKIIIEATTKEATDIHIRTEKKDSSTLIEFRIHGMLQEHRRLKLEEGKSLMSTIYNSFSKGTQPTYQEGKFQDASFKDEVKGFFPKGLHGIRVSSGGHVNGEYMVLRLLYVKTGHVAGKLEDRLVQLGFSKKHSSSWRKILNKPSGMTLIAGSTGSGKSTTMKHTMECFMKEHPELRLYTIEQPVEYPIEGALQLQAEINENGMIDGFAGGLKSSLRCDPDWIVIAEMRDESSALAALRGAMTGHPLISTIHANSAWAIIPRLVAQIASEENILSLLSDHTIMSGLIYQVLLQVICPDCSIQLKGNEDQLDKDLLERIKNVVANSKKEGRAFRYEDIRIKTKTKGCPSCNGMGIVGRTVVAEVVELNRELLQILGTKGYGEARRHWENENPYDSCLQHGLSKVFSGQIDPRDVEAKLGLIDAEVELTHISSKKEDQ